VLAKLGWAEPVASGHVEEVGGAAAEFYDLGSNKKTGRKWVQGRENRIRVFVILKSNKQMNSNVNLNSNTSK
jgi:hypothetical protein